MRFPPRYHVLTGRQRQVVKLVSEGWTMKAIGNLLGISTGAVWDHKEKAMTRANVSDIASLTRWAIRAGLTSV